MGRPGAYASAPVARGWADRAPTPQHPARPPDDLTADHEGAAFQAWFMSPAAPCPAPGDDLGVSDLEAAFRAGAAWHHAEYGA